MSNQKDRRQFIKVIERWAITNGKLKTILSLFPFGMLLKTQIYFCKRIPVKFIPSYMYILEGVELALKNFDHQFTGTEDSFISIDQLAKKNVHETLWALSFLSTSIIKLPWSIRYLLKNSIIPDLSQMRKVYVKGQPILITSPHLSASFLLPFLFALQGYPVTIVEDLFRSDDICETVDKIVEPIRQVIPNIHEIKDLCRETNGQTYENIKYLKEYTFDIELINVKNASSKVLGERIENGRIVILFCDYRHRRRPTGELTDDLYGLKALISRGSASLIAKHNAVVFFPLLSGKEINCNLI